MNKTFFIKQNATFPTLDFELSWSVLKKYNITDEMLENVAITFSMINSENGKFVIANKSGEIVYNDNVDNVDEPKYLLRYCFIERDTRNWGNFYGEFVIDFLDSNQKLKMPTHYSISIIITPSKTKTEIV